VLAIVLKTKRVNQSEQYKIYLNSKNLKKLNAISKDAKFSKINVHKIKNYFLKNVFSIKNVIDLPYFYRLC
jgi:hypothetical protein